MLFTTTTNAQGASGSLLLRCPDSEGIVAGVASSLVTQRANIRKIDVHIEKSTLICRCCFEHHDWQNFDRGVLEAEFSALMQRFEASATLIMDDGRRVDLGDHMGMGTICHGVTPTTGSNAVAMRTVRETGKARIGVFMSKTDHCLLDLLHRTRSGEIPVTIAFVVSNHAASPHLEALLTQAEVPFYHVPHSGRRVEEWEADLRAIVSAKATDFLVLARYMQIISGDFLRWYDGPVVNIHHGLLPSFKGANPYRQAHAAGVKQIGATAHFVTEELDEGPIISQRVSRASHQDTLAEFTRRGEALEAAALSDAVKNLSENRIVRIGIRTVVFA